MKFVLLVLSVLLTGCASFHWSKEEEDKWFAEDKAKHFGYSTATAFAVTWGSRAAGVETMPAATGGFTITITGGLLKELWDATANDGSGWSWRDLTWDLAGTVTGAWVGTVVPRLPGN